MKNNLIREDLPAGRLGLPADRLGFTREEAESAFLNCSDKFSFPSIV
jgi:hypothetical protein